MHMRTQEDIASRLQRVIVNPAANELPSIHCEKEEEEGPK